MARHYVSALVILLLPFAVMAYAIINIQLSMGAAGVHTYTGAVTGIGFDANGTQVDLNLGNLSIDGCYVDSGGCKAGDLKLYRIPDTGSYPALGSPVTLSCTVEPLFRHIMRESTCKLTP